MRVVVFNSDVTLHEINNFLNILTLQKQVQTLPVEHNNNSKMEDKIILLIISIWDTSINTIQSNISSNNSKMSDY